MSETWEAVAEGALDGPALDSVLRATWHLGRQYREQERADLGQELTVWAWEHRARFQERYGEKWPGPFDRALQQFGHTWCREQRLHCITTAPLTARPLSETQEKILTWSAEGRTQAWMAEQLGVSQPRVSQLKDRALKNLAAAEGPGGLLGVSGPRSGGDPWKGRRAIGNAAARAIAQNHYEDDD